MATNGLSVLIGESEVIIALDMQQQLLSLGYEVVIRSGTPTDIVSLARELKPDVIVLDLTIGGDTHGVKVASDIHAIDDIPIVFLTTYEVYIQEVEDVLPRPYRYLIKPFSPARLHATIQELLSSEGSARSGNLP
jgi:two-component SAPR family response regulator